MAGAPVTTSQLLEELLAEVRGLRADLCELRRKSEPPVKPGDLITAIAECVGDSEFTTTDLVHHARYAEPMREKLSGMSPKKIGRLFRKIEGQDFDGLCISRIGDDRDGVLWRICEFGDLGPQTR